MPLLYYKITAINELGESTEVTGSYEPAAPVAGAHAATHAAGGFDPITGDLDANARVGVRKNSTGSTSRRRRVNFIEGEGVQLTLLDVGASEEVRVTIASPKAGAVADVAGADATDEASAVALVNELKAQMNALLASLRAADKLAP